MAGKDTNVGSEKEKCPDKQEIKDFRRLWLGNLDPRINEYNLLKLLQKYGKIEKFDLLFHRNGPLTGQPRGYAFVSYIDLEAALNAKEHLNNQQVGSKNIIVTWAHSANTEEVDKPKPEINIPALAMAKAELKLDKTSQIQAIEAKLKLMERMSSDDLEINKTVSSEPPIIAKYQYNRNQSSTANTKFSVRKNDRYTKPYSKQKTRR